MAREISLSIGEGDGTGEETEPGEFSLIIPIVAAGVVILGAVVYMLLRKRVRLS